MLSSPTRSSIERSESDQIRSLESDQIQGAGDLDGKKAGNPMIVIVSSDLAMEVLVRELQEQVSTASSVCFRELTDTLDGVTMPNTWRSCVAGKFPLLFLLLRR